MSRTVAAPELAGLVALICTCCTSGSPPPLGPASATTPVSIASASPAGPRLIGTISVTGGVRLSSSFNSSATLDLAGTQTPATIASSCSDYAEGYDQSAQSGGGRGFDPPEVHSARVNDQTMYVSVSIATGYAGPGTYDSRRSGSLGGYASQDVDNPAGIVTTTFESRVGGTTILTVNADGSGSLQLLNWGSTEVHGATGAGGVRINASISWICQQ